MRKLVAGIWRYELTEKWRQSEISEMEIPINRGEHSKFPKNKNRFLRFKHSKTPQTLPL
jgi:hypothetical protein